MYNRMSEWDADKPEKGRDETTQRIQVTKKQKRILQNTKNIAATTTPALNAIHYYLFRHKFQCNECTLNEWPFPFYIKTRNSDTFIEKWPVYLLAFNAISFLLRSAGFSVCVLFTCGTAVRRMNGFAVVLLLFTCVVPLLFLAKMLKR